MAQTLPRGTGCCGGSRKKGWETRREGVGLARCVGFESIELCVSFLFPLPFLFRTNNGGGRWYSTRYIHRMGLTGEGWVATSRSESVR